ncbi:NAD-dependent protein deacetylase sirtuin-7-like [Patiria miniata]|uniref:protein acetyllysine N-acetyltransferase n=1 Tax=Patiria miniata TaxID=46514 RepID=A0A914AKT1_PATMI|nr:NAD-dependent protein deacetylase sirtuin-7-like [Patiria miniata]
MATNLQNVQERSRPARNCANKIDRSAVLKKQEVKEKERRVKEVLSKPVKLRSKDDKKLLRECKDVVKELERRARLKELVKKKTIEVEDSSDVLEAKVDELVSAINKSKHLVVYTGAGISTAASIPDYRGPSGVWTLLQKGQEVRTKSLVDADPTLTHMAITELQRQGVVQHVVSQNCDGLHLRSGMPLRALSEVHGNMFIEVCTDCNPEAQYVRLFDVTERTACRRHNTGRRCHTCGGPLRDSIVHFGEKGAVERPLNWPGAVSAASEADMILCLGSTLKVLKRYTCLWGTNRAKAKQPKLYIVNLQWTPKDKMAVLKIHGRCDSVMEKVMSKLELKIPEYKRSHDPIFSMATPLRKEELSTFSTKLLQTPIPESVKQELAPAGSDRVEPDPTGSDQDVKGSTGDSQVAVQPSDMGTVKRELAADVDNAGGGQIGKDLSAPCDGDQPTSVVTKPGWFGKGYHRKITRSRKRRKFSQESV